MEGQRNRLDVGTEKQTGWRDREIDWMEGKRNRLDGGTEK